MTNTAEKKMTYVSALSFVLSNCDLPEDVASKLDMLRAQQEKRNSAEKKPTKTQLANETLAEQVFEVVCAAGHPVTVSEVLELGALNMSNQKCSALMKKLVDAGRVVKTMEKRKAYFAPTPTEVEG